MMKRVVGMPEFQKGRLPVALPGLLQINVKRFLAFRV